MRRLRSSMSACGTARVKGVTASFMDFFSVSVQLNLLTAEGDGRRTARIRSAHLNHMRRSFHECCREGPAHTSCADNDNLFHASPSWPLRQDLRHIRLVDTFNNESVIRCPWLAMLRDTYIAFAVIPILSGFHVREFRNDDSLDRIAFKDFMLSIGDEHFDRMTLHRCSDSRPICFELFLIDCLRSREYNVCRHDRS